MPRFSEARLLEARARATFLAALPPTWAYRESPLDFGADGIVDVFDRDGNATATQFLVELKATRTAPASGPRLQLTAGESTYFASLVLPVLLVAYVDEPTAMYTRWFHDGDGSKHFVWQPEDRWAHGSHASLAADAKAFALKPLWVSEPAIDDPERAIARLEAVLADRLASEGAAEEALLNNPFFMHALSYGAVHRQITLPRAGKDDLRPDVIGERLDDGWAEIVEIKRPTAAVLVGRRNRARLSAAVTEAVAQVREYRTYFDDEAAVLAIRKRYGFRCHRPRGVVIIGREPAGYDEHEQRRALTTHADVRIITYDDLLRAVRRLS